MGMRTSKPKAACFECRYTIKGWRSVCLQCKGPIFNVGAKFRTPPKRDVKEWEKLKIWYVDSDVFRSGPRWVGRGPFLDTVNAQREQFKEGLKLAFDHQITKHGRSRYHAFPYVTFK